MSDRIFAAIWLGACALIAWQMWQLTVPFAYEPVGPKAFPLLLAGLMAVCCGVMVVSPDHDIHWPEPALLGKGALLVTVLLAYAWAFEIAGFPVSTTLMVVAVSRLFGASWKASLVAGLLAGSVGYVIFDRLLEVSLPVGRLWR